MDASPYYLPEHVYSCIAGGVLVFLDLKRDQYFSLDRHSTRALAPLFGQQGSVGDSNSDAQCAGQLVDADGALGVLLAQRLITTDPLAGKRPCGLVLERPTACLSPEWGASLSKMAARHLARFLRGAVRATALLRLCSIERTVRSVRERKAGRQGRDNPERSRELMTAYFALRPLFPRRYCCLFDSLAALEFLAVYGCHPLWVFGVKANPFGAHCWLQQGAVLLNDSVEQVAAFTPIMVV